MFAMSHATGNDGTVWSEVVPQRHGRAAAPRSSGDPSEARFEDGRSSGYGPMGLRSVVLVVWAGLVGSIWGCSVKSGPDQTPLTLDQYVLGQPPVVPAPPGLNEAPEVVGSADPGWQAVGVQQDREGPAVVQDQDPLNAVSSHTSGDEHTWYEAAGLMDDGVR